MKRKSPRIESPKSPARPKRRTNGRNGNGHGNGTAAATLEMEQSEQQLFDGQPPIESLLGTPRGRQAPGELDNARLLAALTALKKGDFTARLPIDLEGLDGKIADAFNDVVELNQKMAQELERLSRVVGKEGKIAQRADIGEVG